MSPCESTIVNFPESAALQDPKSSLKTFQHALDTLPWENKSVATAQLCSVLDRFLQHPDSELDEIETDTETQKLKLTLDTLREQLSPLGQGTMVLAQINPTPGDLAGNAAKIIRYLTMAEAIGVDLIVFPELALMGYPIRDVISRHPFLGEENIKWLKAIAERTRHTRAIVGFVEPRLHAVPYQIARGKPFFNSAAVLGNGQIEGIIRKSLLPNYNEFNDYRTFEPSPLSGAQDSSTLEFCQWDTVDTPPSGNLQMIHHHRYGISICEDTWNDSDFFARPLYNEDPIAALTQNYPDALVNLSASPSRSRKEQLKHQLLSHLAVKYEVPAIYVNQVGAVDESSFDGASRVYDATGKLVARCKSFEEQFLVVNPFKALGVIYPLPPGLENTYGAPKTFNAFDDSDLGRTYQTLLQGIRDYFSKTGFKRAVLGLSGGIDSAVVVTLLVDVLGAENVLALSLPSKITPSENEADAQLLADNLGIPLHRIPIHEVTEGFDRGYQGVKSVISERWGAPHSGSTAMENIQARSRAVWIWMIANEFNAFPIATSDKSEFYLGYTTVHGDMAGSLAPIGDIPKTKVRRLAHWLNKNRATQNAIPLQVIEKPSGADLAIDPETGKTITAESALMPYEFADEIIWRIEALQQSKAQMMHETFQWEQKNDLAPEQKQAWLDKFFHRMSFSVFKWWVSPPVIIVEGYGSLTKTDYHHPITSKNIDWEGKSKEWITEHLQSIATKIPSPTTLPSKTVAKPGPAAGS